MFGEHALSAQPISTQGILQFGSQSVSAEFTKTTSGTYIGAGVVEIEAISSKASIGSGILVGTSEISSEFSQSSNLTRFATGVSAQILSFDQSSTAQRFATGVSEQSSEFVQSADPTKIISIKSDQVSSFEQSTDASKITNTSSEMTSEFTKSFLASVIKSGVIENIVTFDFIQTSGILIYRNDLNVDFAFSMSSNGALLWERIDANTPAEIWAEITASGGAWTPVNAGGTIETWIQKVV